jgi:hypothetical protein
MITPVLVMAILYPCNVILFLLANDPDFSDSPTFPHFIQAFFSNIYAVKTLLICYMF